MLKSTCSLIYELSKASAKRPVLVTGLRAMSKTSHESEEEFNSRYRNYFERPEIDGWEVRKAMNDLCGMDLVPEPTIVSAALRACRRLNDYALAVRFLEAVKFKCGSSVGTIYPYIVQEIKPTLDELGLDLPEALGFDKPELALPSVYDIH